MSQQSEITREQAEVLGRLWAWLHRILGRDPLRGWMGLRGFRNHACWALEAVERDDLEAALREFEMALLRWDLDAGMRLRLEDWRREISEVFQ